MLLKGPQRGISLCRGRPSRGRGRRAGAQPPRCALWSQPATHRSSSLAKGLRLPASCFPSRCPRMELSPGKIGSAGPRNVQTAIDRALAAHCVDLIHLHGLHLEAYSLPANVPVLISLHLPPPATRRAFGADMRAARCFVAPQSHIAAPCPRRFATAPSLRTEFRCRPLRAAGPKAISPWCWGAFAPKKMPTKRLTREAAPDSGCCSLVRYFPSPNISSIFGTTLSPVCVRLTRGRPQHAFLGRLQEQKSGIARPAKCLLHPTLAPETSSLVAMEALAAGTPVIAYRSGAIPEIVEDGVTGFLVENVERDGGSSASRAPDFVRRVPRGRPAPLLRKSNDPWLFRSL